MHKINRREFIGTAAVGAAAISTLGAKAADVPKIKLGLIGCGWYGMVDVEAAFKVGGIEVVALCDVDGKHLEDSAVKVEKLQGRRPKTFKEYEQLLETPGLEAVIIATPPHWHALQFLAALKKNLDIYCEKPLAYDIRECQAMAEAAENTDRVIQIGFQRRQSPAFRQVKKYLQDGNAGVLVQADVQIHYTAGIGDTKPQNPPASLDWDAWCGPAPKLPYSPQIGHMSWRLEEQYGHGHLVDWGIHLIDAARWILDEQIPNSIQAAGGLYYFKDKITTPDTLTAHFEYAKCPLVWRHRIWGAEEYAPEVSNGIFFYGDKETVFAADDHWIVIPRGKGRERKKIEARADLGKMHMEEFLKAVRTREKTSVSTLSAAVSTGTVKAAMIALRCGQSLEWDGNASEFKACPEANRHLRREYRAPYRHPYNG
jgi:predicted dehydrogenase